MLISHEQNTGQGRILASGQEINPVKVWHMSDIWEQLEQTKIGCMGK